SIGDEILSGFINEVIANYRAAIDSAPDPRAALEQIVRSTSWTLAQHRAALTMLQNDWNHFAAQPRFAYLPGAVGEMERTWIGTLELGKQAGLFRPALDAKPPYRLLQDALWVPAQWRRTRGYRADQVAGAFLQILFNGISAGAPGPARA